MFKERFVGFNTCLLKNIYKMEYEFELNLQRAAMIKIAVSVWERESLKRKIRDEYTNNQLKCYDDNWDVLTREVLLQLESIVLPVDLKREIIYMVRSISFKMFSWIDFVAKKLHCDVGVAQEICWTEHGTIDKVKSMESLQVGNPKLKIVNLFNMACYFCNEEFIYKLWEHLPSEKQTCQFYNRELYKKYEHHLVAYWKYCINHNLPSLVQYLVIDHCNIYNVNYTVEENMLRLCVSEGFELAAKYFWNKLDKDEKRRNLFKSAMAVLKKSTGNYSLERKEGYVEIFIFLLKKLSEEEKDELIEEEAGLVLNLFLSAWPWQEFFMPIFEAALDRLSQEDYIDLCEIIVDKLTEDHNLGISLQECKFRRILHEVWKKSSPELKESVNVYSNGWYILKNLLSMEDIQSMKMIINDPCLEEERAELIADGNTFFSKLIHQNKYNLIEEFIQEILMEHETTDFKDSIVKKADVAYSFVLKDAYDDADRFLNFILDSETQRDALKKEMAYKHTYSCRKKISMIWSTNCKDTKVAQTKTMEFLNWCCIRSEAEVIDFKHTVYDFRVLEEGMNNFLLFCRCFDVIEEFLVWCLLTRNEIKQLRIKYKRIFRRNVLPFYK